MVSCIAGRFFTDRATRQAPTSLKLKPLKNRAFLLSHKHFLTCYCDWKNGMPGLAAKAASDSETLPLPSLPIRKPMVGYGSNFLKLGS